MSPTAKYALGFLSPLQILTVFFLSKFVKVKRSAPGGTEVEAIINYRSRFKKNLKKLYVHENRRNKTGICKLEECNDKRRSASS
jgi:hypothetical protein